MECVALFFLFFFSDTKYRMALYDRIHVAYVNHSVCFHRSHLVELQGYSSY